MKPKRGTPSKSEVRKLRKMFEIDASLQTRGDTELLSQSSMGLNPLNLGCTGLDMENCASQPGWGTRTGPRQTGELILWLSQDWTNQTRQGLGDQPGGLLQDWA